MSDFRCWMPAYGETSDEARAVVAIDAWHAAKEFAEWADNDSGAEMSQNGLRPGHDGYIIHVIASDGRETKWRVWPEAEVRWYAGTVGP